MTFLQGKKTYVVVACTLVYAVSAFYLHYITPEQFSQLILNALGIAGLRNAIK